MSEYVDEAKKWYERSIITRTLKSLYRPSIVGIVCLIAGAYHADEVKQGVEHFGKGIKNITSIVYNCEKGVDEALDSKVQQNNAINPENQDNGGK